MPFSHDRASLATLPAELLSKIYAEVFAGSIVYYRESGTTTITQNDTTEAESSLLQLRLTSKRIAYNPTLTREFLRTTTIVLSNAADLNTLTRALQPHQLPLVRKVCIRVQNRGPSSTLQKGKKWTSVTLPMLKSVFRNLRTLDVQQSGVFIDMFRVDVPYSLAEILATKKQKRNSNLKHQICASDDSLSTSMPACTLTSSTSKTSTTAVTGTTTGSTKTYTPPTTTTTSLIPKSYQTTHAHWIATHFSSLLSESLSRTAVKLDETWYRSIIRDAVSCNVEMTWSMSIMFAGGRCDDEVVVKDARVSSQDWMLGFCVQGVEYEFAQTRPEWLEGADE